ncbi:MULTISPECIES: hypothetical protein [Bacillus]|uniref:Secreted protein n=1 Tax=Bacillus capparidis TaxID=1840411 RepID=A0ABS4CWC0_9BACI|nr:MULTISPECIES: hypothetical protein [Bacillus]MBP1081874.1 hypothetical protein [Bacillus capparidis]MED1096523.1 hypothetical protein [Bacillus capparidis]
MKRIHIFFLVLLFASIVPLWTATAAAGEWDLLGGDRFSDESDIWPSGGGDYKICLSSESKPGYYQLFEEDPYNPDDQVKTGVYFKTAGSNDFDSNGCHVYKDIGGFVDGTDDQAEFYLKKYSSGESFAWFYD